jgi:hypothetical protein
MLTPDILYFLARDVSMTKIFGLQQDVGLLKTPTRNHYLLQMPHQPF